jgi:hypothetical protein
MSLCDDSKLLIISINLCNIKKMIHLSNLELDDFSSLSRRNLRDSSFQDTIIKVLIIVGKSFLNLMKENHGLHEDNVIAEHMISSTLD